MNTQTNQAYFLFEVWLCLFVLCNPGLLSAQLLTTSFERIPIEVNGLKSEGVNALVQDYEGFLWISTSMGLVKYDGYEFKSYKNKIEDSTAILSNRIETLHVDYRGDLWIGTAIGFSRYEAQCDCFFNYPLKEEDYTQLERDVGTIGITDITEDQNNTLWIAVQGGGLLQYDREKDKFIRHLARPDDPNALHNDIVRVLLADHQDNIWIGTGYGNPKSGGGLIRYNPKAGTVKRFKHDPDNPNSLVDNRVSALLEDEEGRIWVGTYQSGLHQFRPEQEDFIRMAPDPENPDRIHAPVREKPIWQNDPFVSILHQDQQGGMWVGTIGQGINHFDGKTGKLHFYAPSTTRFNFYWSLLEDRFGQIWLGNVGESLYKMDLAGPKYKVFPHLSQIRKSCESKSEPQHLWLSSHRGLYKLNLDTGIHTHFQHNENNDKSLGDNFVNVAYEDRDGTLWLGLGGEVHNGSRAISKGGLDRFDKKTGIFHHYPIRTDPSIDFNETVYNIVEDKEGFLWLATGTGGIFKSDKDKIAFRPFHFPDNKANSLKKAEVYHLQEAAGHLWACDEKEPATLYRYDYSTNSFSPFLDGFKTTSITEDSNGWYWIGTWKDQGLLHLNPADRTYQRYTLKDGLPSNGNIHVVEGENGIFWIGTEYGLCTYDSKTKQFSTEGLPQEYITLSGFKTSDGHILFSGKNGLYVFQSGQTNEYAAPPNVILNDLLVSGEVYPLEKDQAGINLSYLQNDISFGYTGIHFADPAKNQYKYKLEPYDKDWIKAGTQRTVRYTNLDPGEYTFRVTAANRDGLWNKQGTSLPFRIHVAWWNTWWAYTLFIAFAGLIIYGIYHFQLSKKLAEEESIRLRELHQLRTSLYTNITHEFRTPLTVILGMTENLKSSLADISMNGAGKSLEMIRRNGKNLLQLVNEMLDLAKLESGNMELQLRQSDVIPFIKYLCESFQSLAAEKQINLSIQTDIDRLVMDFDEKKLETIVSNLLSNAIKFTEANGAIEVQLHQIQKKERAYFSIKVKDNGVGISKEESANIFDRFYQADNSTTRRGESARMNIRSDGGTGIGLALTKELVLLMNGTIDVQSTLGKGSEFTVQLPISTGAEEVETISVPAAISRSAILDATPLAPSADHDQERPLVLMIEDNADVAFYLRTALEAKYECLHAADGVAGIEMALEKVPDIIICDVMIPGKDGFEVCNTLKTDERTDHIPIVMLTAKVTQEDRLTGLAHGADAYLDKPFEKAELMIRMNNLMDIRKTLQKKYSGALISSQQNHKATEKAADFLERIEKIVLDHLDQDFSIEELAGLLNLSRSQLHRKIKALTGMSTAIYVRFIRLQKAKELLVDPELSISEIAYQVGFKSPVYFSQMYKQTFGESPSSTRDPSK